MLPICELGHDEVVEEPQQILPSLPYLNLDELDDSDENLICDWY